MQNAKRNIFISGKQKQTDGLVGNKNTKSKLNKKNHKGNHRQQNKKLKTKQNMIQDMTEQNRSHYRRTDKDKRNEGGRG